MRRKKVVISLTLLFVFACFVGWLLEHLVVPLFVVNVGDIRSSISRSAKCHLYLAVETLEGEGHNVVVLSGWSAILLSAENFWHLHSKFSLRDLQDGIWSQMGVLSIYEELLLSKYVWVTVVTLCLVHISMNLLLFNLIASLCCLSDESHRSLNQLERDRFKLNFEKSFVEKMILVLFVLTRSQRSTERENMIAAGYIPQQRITSEASIFFIWLATIWSVHTICDQCSTRLEQLLRLSSSQNFGLCYALVGVQLLVVGASGSFLSVAFCSFGLLDSFYAFLMTFQAISVFLHVIQSLAMSGFKIYNQNFPAWLYLFTCFEHFFIALDVGVSLVLGCIINGNIVAVCLVSKFVHSISDACRILKDIV